MLLDIHYCISYLFNLWAVGPLGIINQIFIPIWQRSLSLLLCVSQSLQFIIYLKKSQLLQFILKYCLLVVDLHLISFKILNLNELPYKISVSSPRDCKPGPQLVWELYHCVHPFSLYSNHISVSLFCLFYLQILLPTNLPFC